MSQIGVYQILSKIDGKRYVGSALVSFRTRWRQHRSNLRAGRHINKHLQSAWNKHGEANFLFHVIVECPAEDCLVWEQNYITHFKSSDREFGYNACPVAGTTLGFRYSHTESTKVRMSLTRKGKKLPWQGKISAANKGRKNSVAARLNMILAWKVRKQKYGPGGGN